MLNDDVRYAGEVDFERKLELLGSARALLNPIQWPEPFGLVRTAWVRDHLTLFERLLPSRRLR